MSSSTSSCTDLISIFLRLCDFLMTSTRQNWREQTTVPEEKSACHFFFSFMYLLLSVSFSYLLDNLFICSFICLLFLSLPLTYHLHSVLQIFYFVYSFSNLFIHLFVYYSKPFLWHIILRRRRLDRSTCR